MTLRSFSLLLSVGLLAACASGPPPLSPELGQLAVLPTTELPPPSARAADPAQPYLIGAYDKVEVDVFGVPELTKREIQADASGRLSFPFAGSIEAAGLSSEQLADEIASRLRGRYIRDPLVSVNITDPVSQRVTVDGEVEMPGQYPLLGRSTLMRAIASARGVSEFAKLTEVVVFRTVEGQEMAALYDLQAIRNGAYADPAIYPDDVIVVGDSPARRRFRDIVQLAPVLSAPIITLLSNRQ